MLGAPLVPFCIRFLRRRTILIWADLLRCLLVLGLIWVDQPDRLWLLYVLVGLQGFLGGIYFPVRTAILPMVVADESELGAATTLTSLSWTGMIALGTALGGLITTLLGTSVAFAVDAATYLVSGYFVLQLRYRPASESARGGQASHAAGSRDANEDASSYPILFRFLRQRKDFLWLSLKKTAVSVFSYTPSQVLQILLSQRYPQIGPSSLLMGYIFSIGGLVSFFCPIVVRLFTGNDHRKMRFSITLAYIVAAAGMLLQAPVPHFAVLLLGVALRSIGAVLIWVFSTQLLLSLTPVHLRDHMLSFEYFLFNLTGILGVVLPALTAENPSIGLFGTFLALATAFLMLAVAWEYWLRKGRYGPKPLPAAVQAGSR